MGDRAKRGRPVRHHDDDSAALTYAHDRLAQGRIARGIEVGIGLIEHHQERIAIECPGEAEALALARGEFIAAAGEIGLIAVRKREDRLVQARGTGGGDYGLGRRFRIEAGDILGQRAFDKFDRLRHIAQGTAEHLRSPLVMGGAVDADLAARGAPDAKQRLGQRALAGGARPDHRDGLTGLDGQADAGQDKFLRTGRRDPDVPHRYFAVRRCQRHLPLRRRAVGKDRRDDPRPAFAGRGQAPPVGQRLIDRRQCAASQNRGGDNDPAARLVIDHEQRADGQDQRLQEQPENASGAPKPRHRAGEIGLRLQIFGVAIGTAGKQAALHPHRHRALGKAQFRLGCGKAPAGKTKQPVRARGAAAAG